MKNVTHHLQHYLPLLGILAAAIVGFFVFSYDNNFQAVVIIAASAGYVTWGIIHHYIHQDLHLSVILEYIALALLGVVIVLSMLFRV